jgi:hypothetical protein
MMEDMHMYMQYIWCETSTFYTLLVDCCMYVHGLYTPPFQVAEQTKVY